MLYYLNQNILDEKNSNYTKIVVTKRLSQTTYDFINI